VIGGGVAARRALPLGQHPSMPRCLADETLALGSVLPRSVGPHSIGTAEATHRVGPSAGMSFRLSFHLALLSPTGAHWLDRPPDTSCKDSTRRYAVDDPLLSCKRQVGGSSPPASSQKRRSQACNPCLAWPDVIPYPRWNDTERSGGRVIRKRGGSLQVQVFAGRSEVAPPDAEGVARLLATAMEQDQELGLCLRLAVVLGARRSELIALKWRDIDLGAGEVLIAGGVVRVAGQPLIDKDTHGSRFPGRGEAPWGTSHRPRSAGDQAVLDCRSGGGGTRQQCQPKHDEHHHAEEHHCPAHHRPPGWPAANPAHRGGAAAVTALHHSFVLAAPTVCSPEDSQRRHPADRGRRRAPGCGGRTLRMAAAMVALASTARRHGWSGLLDTTDGRWRR
jgi:hypothetical protein